MSNTTNIKKFLDQILMELDELKAVNITKIDIKNRSALGDYIIIASGNSSRHINSIASRIIKKNKKKVISVEGLKTTEWVIVDFGDLILNLFRPDTRDYYSLEKIWENGVEDEKMNFG